MSENPATRHAPEEFFERGELEAAKAILQGLPLELQRLLDSKIAYADAVGKNGMTLLLWAVSHKQVECCKRLLTAGADPNKKIHMGDQEFQLVALLAGGGDDELFELFLSSNGDPNSMDNGDPAIFSTIHARRWDRMAKLLDCGADINLASKNGCPPVIYLAKINQYEQVALMINRGADPKIKEFGGATLADFVGNFSLDPSTPNGQWHAKVKVILEGKGINVPR